MATEMNSLFDACDWTSCKTVGTTAGLTDTNTTSDPSTTGPLLVIVFTPNDCHFDEHKRTDGNEHKKNVW